MIHGALAALAGLPILLAQAPASHPAAPGMGHPGEGPHACVAAEACAYYDDPYNHGCGSRGGPGCRKENGRCASWRDRVAHDCRIQPRAPAPS